MRFDQCGAVVQDGNSALQGAIQVTTQALSQMAP